MKNRVKEKIDYAAERLGFDATSNQLIEEMSELTKVVCKMNRFKGLGQPIPKEISGANIIDSIIEEIADTKVVLEQMIHLIDAERSVSEIMEVKTQRTYERMGWAE